MPTGTFFRLAEEKRTRLMDAAWEEFTQAPYDKASINRIIQNAQIPRGSFYQYFEDKDDLFQYMMDALRTDMQERLLECLDGVGGDLFVLPLVALDQMIHRTQSTSPGLERFLHLCRLNHNLEGRQLLPRAEEQAKERFYARMDRSRLRRRDTDYIENVFFMVAACLGCALMETMREPERSAEHRALLKERIEIIRLGCCLPEGENGGGITHE